MARSHDCNILYQGILPTLEDIAFIFRLSLCNQHRILPNIQRQFSKFPRRNRGPRTHLIPIKIPPKIQRRDYLTPKLSLTATPKRSIASVIFSSAAAANVARKNISVWTKPSRSATNQLPLLTRTPWLTAARKISSSISERDLVLAWGCRCQLTLSQS